MDPRVALAVQMAPTAPAQKPRGCASITRIAATFLATLTDRLSTSVNPLLALRVVVLRGHDDPPLHAAGQAHRRQDSAR